MKTAFFTLIQSVPVAEQLRLLRLQGDTDAVRAPGQFVMLSLPGFFLRRPFSVLDWGEGWLELLVEQAGAGTAQLYALPCGARLEVTTGLGNGFTLSDAGRAPVLVGGGSGVAPLVGLAGRLSESGCRVRAVLGFRSAGDVCCLERFSACADGLTVFTEDGSFGRKGLATDAEALREATKLYACGPEGLLRALCRSVPGPGELALDVRMGCGFGACMGCSVPTAGGRKRVCRDGPVFRMEELTWDD